MTTSTKQRTELSVIPKALAYEVTEEGEGNAVIVFATSSAAARRDGANILNSEWSYVTCRRAQWADAYKPGPVPDLVKIDMGWRVTCHGCECWISSDCEDYDSESGKARMLRPVEDDRGLFCTAGCRSRYLADREARKRAEQRVTVSLRAKLAKLLPNATPISDWMGRDGYVYVTRDRQTNRYRAQEAYVAFSWPGSKYQSGKLGIDRKTPKPTVTVCVGDVASFKAWKAAGYPSVMPASEVDSPDP